MHILIVALVALALPAFATMSPPRAGEVARVFVRAAGATSIAVHADPDAAEIIGCHAVVFPHGATACAVVDGAARVAPDGAALFVLIDLRIADDATGRLDARATVDGAEIDLSAPIRHRLTLPLLEVP
jgi:hypothetical protein